jgi:CD109 antigen
LKVDVTVFNYILRPKREVTAEIKMFNKDNEFEFVEATASGGVCNIASADAAFRTKSLKVPTGNGASTYFLIRALVTGEIKIKVKASTSSHGDEVERLMLVENEGLTKYENKAFLIDLRKKERDSYVFELPIISEKIIWRSIMIETSVIGDLLGPALANIHNLM